MELMHCGVWVGEDRFEVQEHPKPVPGTGEVRVRVEACGVCLTDVHSIQGAFGPPQPPRVLGHEFGGVIDQLGPEVTSVAVGTPVTCAARGGFAEYVVLPADRAFHSPLAPRSTRRGSSSRCCAARRPSRMRICPWLLTSSSRVPDRWGSYCCSWCAAAERRGQSSRSPTRFGARWQRDLGQTRSSTRPAPTLRLESAS